MNTSAFFARTNLKQHVPTGVYSLLTALLILSAGIESGFAQVTFTKVVDTTMSVPGGTGNFSYLYSWAVDGDRTVFYGEDGTGDEGLYSYTPADGITVIANTLTDVPMVPDTKFATFISGDAGGGDVFFFAQYRNGNGFLEDGIYQYDPDWVDPNGILPNGRLTVVIDESMPIPGGEGEPLDPDDDLYFEWFGTPVGPGRYDARPHYSNGDLFFMSFNFENLEGIYRWNSANGMITNLVDTNFEIPGGGQNFSDIGLSPFGNGSQIVFQTREEYKSPYNTALYRLTPGGSSTLVADDTTMIPGRAEVFEQFPESVIMDNGDVVFTAEFLTSGDGLYLAKPNGDIEKIADDSTRVPGGYGTFSSFSNIGTSGSRVVFVGAYHVGDQTDYSTYGIFAYSGGVIRPIIRAGDLIDGRETETFFPSFSMSSDSLDGDTLCFRVNFKDAPDDDAIYLANIADIENAPPLPIYVGGAGATKLAPVDAFSSDVDVPSFRAAEIEMAEDATVYSVTFEGSYTAAQTIGGDAFTIQFLNDDNGVDGDLPGTTASDAVSLDVISRTDTGVDEYGLDVYRYEANLSVPIVVTAGSYWLSIANDTSNDADDDWQWMAASKGFFDTFTAKSTTAQSGPYTENIQGVPVFSLLSTIFTADTPENPGTTQVAPSPTMNTALKVALTKKVQKLKKKLKKANGAKKKKLKKQIKAFNKKIKAL